MDTRQPWPASTACTLCYNLYKSCLFRLKPSPLLNQTIVRLFTIPSYFVETHKIDREDCLLPFS
jgi:hypothetical protein